MKILTLIGIGVFAVAGFVGSAALAAPKIGDAAPDFELQGTDGQSHHLADYKDKQAVVLAWFPKAFTNGCTAECKSMKEEGDAIRKFDVAYFMISVDPMDPVDKNKGNKAFAEAYSADFPILSDPEKKTANDYGVLKADPKGDTAHRWTFYIDKSGKITAIEKHIDTNKAGKDIAAKLQELGVDEKK
jgi:thioredoxin-dependent peroxiredoxin